MQITLKLSQVLSLSSGLDALDGYRDTAKTADGEQVIVRPYIFADPKIRWAVAKNRRLIKGHVEDYTTSKDGIIKELADGGIRFDEKDDTKMAAFVDKHNALLKTEVTVEKLSTLKLADLLNEREEKDKDGQVKKVSNPIPSSVLEALFDIIEE